MNKDLFRKTYKVLTEEDKVKMNKIKDAAQALQDVIEECGKSRELSLATTNLQQSVFWAVSHVTNPESQ